MKPWRQFAHALRFLLVTAPAQIVACLFLALFFGHLGNTMIERSGASCAWWQHPDIYMLWIGIFSLQTLIWGFTGKMRIGSSNDSLNGWGGLDGSLYFWTRAMDRQMLFWSKLLLYALFVILLLLPVVRKMQSSQGNLQMSFRGEADHSAFQHDLLSDPALGAHQSYDQRHNILINVPQGRELQLELCLFELVAASLLILWIAFQIPLKRAAFVNCMVFFPLLPMVCDLAYDMLPGHQNLTYISDTYNYHLQFMTYAGHEKLAWVALFFFGLFVIWSIRRKYLMPSA